MKWIALRRRSDKLLQIVRIKEVARFVCGGSGEGMLAQIYPDTIATHEVVYPDANSEAGKMLDRLNGPVGEVPYK